MLYTISDPHLSLSCDKPMDIFGPRWKNHAEKMRENWIKTVTDDDTVVMPGDISWAMTLDEAKEDLKFIDGLPGNKIIGKGNHDYWWDTAAKLEKFRADNGFSTISFLYNNARLAQGKIICGTRGWTCEEKLTAEDLKLIDREACRLHLSLQAATKLKAENPDAEIIPFLHFPPATPFAVQDKMFDVLLEYGVTRVYYGHLHGMTSDEKLCRFKYGIELNLVSADRLEFKPLRID